MRHWTYQELVESLPNDFVFGRSQGLSMYMAVAMVNDGDESDLVESFIRHTFSLQMFADKLDFVCAESVKIYKDSRQKRLDLAKTDLSEEDFKMLEVEVERTLAEIERVPNRDYEWVRENML